MATVRGGMLKAGQPRAGAQARVERLPLDGLPAPRVRVLQSESQVSADDERLDEARVIVCAGAGLGGAENLSYVNDLAEAVHGVVGGTRRVVDAGWLPRQKQIGLTGVILAPELYIGVGVRGAFNHAIGILRAGTVVAINNDPDALIMQHADIAVIGDYREIVPALAEAFRNRN
jgi:electron transfer flavoprotein alpha subunit